MISSKLDRLRQLLRSYERLFVAFSGGVDSALVAYVSAEELGSSSVAVTAVSPSLAPRERTAARAFARRHGISHVEVYTDEEERDGYVANAGDRCFYCKSALFDALEPLASLAEAAIALGTNLDDLGDHRPGLAAANQRGAIAPLVEAGFTKRDVRQASGVLGLETAEKPAAACLASRVAYGDPVSGDILERIGSAEAALQDLGFPELRVRSHGNGSVARLEVPSTDIERVMENREVVRDTLLAAGFLFASADLGGLKSGGMNALLQIRSPS